MGDPNMLDLLEAIHKLTSVVEDIRDDMRAQVTTTTLIDSSWDDLQDAALNLKQFYKTNGVEFG